MDKCNVSLRKIFSRKQGELLQAHHKNGSEISCQHSQLALNTVNYLSTQLTSSSYAFTVKFVICTSSIAPKNSSLELSRCAFAWRQSYHKMLLFRRVERIKKCIETNESRYTEIDSHPRQNLFQCPWITSPVLVCDVTRAIFFYDIKDWLNSSILNDTLIYTRFVVRKCFVDSWILILFRKADNSMMPLINKQAECDKMHWKKIGKVVEISFN